MNEPSKLIEICCMCGFVHRDDRHRELHNKQKKLHYHWMPMYKGKLQELVVQNYTLHATICVACANNNVVDWKTYAEQRINTPAKYYVKLSYNASLPTKYSNTFDALYNEQANHYNIEL